MNVLGIVFYLLAVGAAWLFRIAYLGWFGSFLFWTITLLPPCFTLISLPAMLGVRLQLSAPSQVCCGEPVKLWLHFKSKWPLPVPRIRVRLSVQNLYTGQTRQLNLQYEALMRGRYPLTIPTEAVGALHIKVERLACSDVIDMISFQRKTRDMARCVVLPIPLAPESAAEEEKPPEVQPRMIPKYGGGFSEDYELRQYRPGDMMNSVHWKLSSKTEDLVVREALIPENSRYYVVLRSNGRGDRGLRSLYWLSLRLNESEIPHTLVSNKLYPVSDEAGTLSALREILSAPQAPAVATSFPDARVIYSIDGEEVSVS